MPMKSIFFKSNATDRYGKWPRYHLLFVTIAAIWCLLSTAIAQASVLTITKEGSGSGTVTALDAVYFEGFESADLTRFPWSTGGNGSWSVKSGVGYGGTYGAEAPQSITDSQSSHLEVPITTSVDGNVSFRLSVSSEANYDFLRFKIDGIEKGAWSGTIGWTQVSYPVTAGAHVFRWEYTKDSSASLGSDTAWIDDISIPNNSMSVFSESTGTVSYNNDVSVVLSALTATGTTFSGWSGACTGTALCQLNMDTDRNVTATFTLTPTNGTCGTSNAKSFVSTPISNLCGSGTATAVCGEGPWTWDCLGINLGTTASCSANLAVLRTVTSLNDSGVGSLRQAITDANPGDFINFGVTGVITIAGELLINKDINIEGPGVNSLTVQRDVTAGSFRIFNINGATALISGLTIKGGSISGKGGGIYNQSLSHLTLTNCAIINNTAASVMSVDGGGGIYNAGTLTMSDCTISDNEALFTSGSGVSSNGGGVRNYQGVMTITNSTISNNFANSGYGGGIYNTGQTDIINSTISGNSAHDGGGIYDNYQLYGTRLLLRYVTVYGNAAYVGGGIYLNNSFVHFKYIIVAGSTGGDFRIAGSITWITFTDSIIQDRSVYSSALYSGDPLLGPLANNGGPTKTHELLTGSIAINKIPQGTFGCTAGYTDQRGISRPQGLSCDIGAYETVIPLAATFTSDKTSPQLLSSAGNISFTAQASGGSEVYEYKFWLKTNGIWNQVQDYSSTNTWTWNTTGATAGAYDVLVYVRNVGSSEAYEVLKSLTYVLLDNPPATGATLTPDIASPQMIGNNNITFTAGGIGGSGNYEYMFWFKTNGVWNIVQTYSTTNTWTWNTNGVAAGSYDVLVYVRNSGSGAAYEALNSLTYALVATSPATGATIAPDMASPQIIGINPTFTAGGIGGSGNYEYKFWLKTNGVWAMVRNYSTTNTWTWNTSSAAVGTYGVQVQVRNVGSSAKYEGVKTMSYVLSPPPVTGATLVPNIASPQTAGAHITFTAGGIGGSGNYEYKFWIKANGVWTVVQDYAATNTYFWNTTGLAPGTYRAQVYVRNVGSSAKYEAVLGMGYVVK